MNLASNPLVDFRSGWVIARRLAASILTFENGKDGLLGKNVERTDSDHRQ